MYYTINSHDFTSAFRRFARDDQFTHEALITLFDYLEEMEASTGEQMELDVIAICSEWAEYSDAKEACEDQGLATSEELEEMDNAEAMKLLRGETTVLEFNGGIVLQQV